MLSSNELSKLYKIISDENKTFESINNSFKELFNENDFIKILISLTILINDNLLNISQRIISFYIIDIIQKQLSTKNHPFFPLFLETMNKTMYKIEQNFLLDLLNNQITFANSTVKNYLKDNIIINDNLYEKNFMTPKSFEGDIKIKIKNEKIRPVLYDGKKSDIKNIINHTNLSIDEYMNINQELNLNFFEPNYMSFHPRDNHNFIDKEPIWIMPNLKHKFIWKNDEKESK